MENNKGGLKMLVKNLPKKDFERLNKAFKEEVKADLIDCWGESDLNYMAKLFKTRCAKRDPKTTAVLESLDQ